MFGKRQNSNIAQALNIILLAYDINKTPFFHLFSSMDQFLSPHKSQCMLNEAVLKSFQYFTYKSKDPVSSSIIRMGTKNTLFPLIVDIPSKDDIAIKLDEKLIRLNNRGIPSRFQMPLAFQVWDCIENDGESEPFGNPYIVRECQLQFDKSYYIQYEYPLYNITDKVVDDKITNGVFLYFKNDDELPDFFETHVIS